MIGGRKPKPLALHVVDGTIKKQTRDRKTALLNSPQPTLGVASPPETFNDEHRAVWARLVADSPDGLLTRLDYDLLVNYVLLIVARDKAMRQYIETGCMVLMRSPDRADRMQSNPLMRELRRVLEQLRPLQAELGFTPMSRSRIQLAKGEGDEDELSGFLRGPQA
jgi:P27 family predicted phage terminase small subunit